MEKNVEMIVRFNWETMKFLVPLAVTAYMLPKIVRDPPGSIDVTAC